MAEIRTPRALTTRASEMRNQYVEPSALPEPTPEPGYVFHWVATHIAGQADPVNVSRRMREGFVPVRADEHPEMGSLANRETGNVELGGLMLCKMPKELWDSRVQAERTKSQAQMTAADNMYLRERDARMPMFSENRSEVTRGASFGNGS